MELPIEIKVAFVDAIEGAAICWRDGISDYTEFRRVLNQMAKNIYRAGAKSNQPPHKAKEGE